MTATRGLVGRQSVLMAQCLELAVKFRHHRRAGREHFDAQVLALMNDERGAEVPVRCDRCHDDGRDRWRDDGVTSRKAVRSGAGCGGNDDAIGCVASKDLAVPPPASTATPSTRRFLPALSPRADHLEALYDADVDGHSRLAWAVRPVLEGLSEDLADTSTGLVLSDEQSHILARHVSDRILRGWLDRIQLAPGFRYGEEHVGASEAVATSPGHLPYYAARSLLRMFIALGASVSPSSTTAEPSDHHSLLRNPRIPRISKPRISG
jgi:hypothetical protein